MSEQAADSSASPESPAGEKAPAKVRRISNPRAKKTAKVKEETSPAPAAETPSVEKVENAAPVSESQRAEEDHAPQTGEWSDPETIASGQSEGGNKRNKRRRRKGKGGNNSQQPGAEEFPSSVVSPEGTSAPVAQPQQPRPQQQQHQRPKVDTEEQAKKAWKIFLAEVSEEGVALIGDHDAKELARRCFRLAEIFIEEQGKRRF
ncbi:MAG: hypothetical protein QM680_08510 [Luteolibacter sp.]